VLIIVENLPSPLDRRVWQEATTLKGAGYEVSIICPTGLGCEERYEALQGIHIYRHPMPGAGTGPAGYLLEYGVALFWEFVLAWRVLLRHGFDAIHACNPPDLIFLVGGFFKLLLGKKFLFDHHDISPELYEAKFGRRGFLYRLLLKLERWSFAVADVSIATNESYRRIAIQRGRMPVERVFVVRTGPNLERMKIIEPIRALKNGRRYLVGYAGLMGKQDGIDYLLRAVAHIVHDMKREDVQFVLMGTGDEFDNVCEYASELGVDEYVTFAGHVGDDRLLQFLNTADVCVGCDVANDLNDKSTMIKIMEYMAVAKPIVQFDLAEGRYSAGGSSLYAKGNDERDLAAKIVELLDDPEARARMGRLGRRRVLDTLAWNYEVPKLLAAYAALFDGVERFIA